MKELIIKTILEGLGLGALLVLVCAVGIRKSAVEMVYLYSAKVQERCVNKGLTKHKKSRKTACFLKQFVCPDISHMCLSAPMR